MEVSGVEQLAIKLDDLSKKAKKEIEQDVVVGYSAKYAVFVHENLDAHHKEGKQAKFLETPARALAGQMGQLCADVTEKTGDVSKGMFAAGLLLQRESQKIVPVDTGALKASAFTMFIKK